MAIYRGAGGTTDTTDQATVDEVTTLAAQAASSASSASTSASSASTSASTATTQATNAATSATSAASSATTASQAKDNAITAKLAAEAAQVAAELAQATAETAKDTAVTYGSNAVSANTTAQAAKIAAETARDVTKGYRDEVLTSEVDAAGSATAAAASATSAASSASAASASATAAAASESTVAASATSAANSATASAASATAAAASETAAAASESAAATSESNASTSATNAANSASAASTSATAATTKATEAATSATSAASSALSASSSASAAATSASSASASADAALAALDSFDDRYLGQKATDPTLDNDGNALVAGALYFNTTDDVMKVYEGSVWVAAYASLSGAVLQANNLSDLLDVSAARTNLGLGTAATTNSTAYATAAQGALADSALQSFTETDPVYTASSWYTTTNNATNWNTAYGWGNHASAGYQAAATALTTSTTFSGDVSGTYNAIVVADDSHNHIIANVDGLQTALDGKSATTHNHTLDSLSNTTITSNTSGEILKWNGTAWVNNTLAEAGIQPAGSYLTGNQTITLTGDASGSGTTSIAVTVNNDSHSHSTSTITGLGALATLSSVGAAQITDNSVGAAELNVVGNGTTAQYLRSDGDGTFTWATPTDTNTTYSASTGLTLTGTAFSVNYGTASGTACQGNDSRLSNSRQCNNSFDNAATARSNLGLGYYATLAQNSVINITNTTAATSADTGALQVDGGIGLNGSLYAGGNVTAYSDARLKTNVKVISDALTKVNQISGYTYDRIDMELRQTGVIAQEVLAVLPEAVTGSEEELYGVNYGSMVGLLIEAIKELKAEVDSLKEGK